VKFHLDDTAASPEDEWRARTSPWLLADDRHQACIRRAVAAGSLTVDAYCECPKTTVCMKECCQ
jgi:hypothetical protein